MNSKWYNVYQVYILVADVGRSPVLEGTGLRISLLMNSSLPVIGADREYPSLAGAGGWGWGAFLIPCLLAVITGWNLRTGTVFI